MAKTCFKAKSVSLPCQKTKKVAAVPTAAKPGEAPVRATQEDRTPVVVPDEAAEVSARPVRLCAALRPPPPSTCPPPPPAMPPPPQPADPAARAGLPTEEDAAGTRVEQAVTVPAKPAPILVPSEFEVQRLREAQAVANFLSRHSAAGTGTRDAARGPLPEASRGAEACSAALEERRARLRRWQRTVRFDLSSVSVHEVTPYSEIYGMHPRDFVFDRDFYMVPAQGFVSLGAALAADAARRRQATTPSKDDEEEEEEKEEDAAGSPADAESSSSDSDGDSEDEDDDWIVIQ